MTEAIKSEDRVPSTELSQSVAHHLEQFTQDTASY